MKDYFQGRKQTLAKYSESFDSYAFRLINQGGGCAICGEKPYGMNSFPVDHDHATGRVRGILCPDCNKGLGFFKDSPSRMTAAIQYLARGAI